MDYETGIFRRYIRNRKGKEVTQVGVSGLSVNSKFEDGEEIYILGTEELTELVTQVQTKDDEIQKLKNQLIEAQTEIENLKNDTPEPTPEPPNYINKVLELQEEINNRNGLLMNTQNTINNIFNEVNTANNTSKENLITLISELQTEVKTILEYSQELPNQVNGINSSIDNTSWFKWIRSKNKFKIILDFDKLNELEAKLIHFTSNDIVQMANKIITPVEIPTDKLDLNELFIPIGNDNSSTEIVVKPAEANNGNDS